MSAVSIFSPDVEEFVWDGSVISVQFERSNSTFCTSNCVVSAGYEAEKMRKFAQFPSVVVLLPCPFG
jgi:hypothetical protein